jgi:hypothetical protein
VSLLDGDQEFINAMIMQIQNGILSIDEARNLMGRAPWGLPETSDPITGGPFSHLGHTDTIDDAAKADARAIFEGRDANNRSACYYCGGIHVRVAKLSEYLQPCPRIKRVVYGASDHAAEIEFWPNGSWETGVVFPGDVAEDETDE